MARYKFTIEVDVPADVLDTASNLSRAAKAAAAVLDALSARDLTVTEITTWRGAA